MRVNADVLEAMLQPIIDAIDAGSGPGRLRFYSPPVAAVEDVPTSTLLADVELPSPVGTVTGAVLTFDTVVNGAAVGGGDVFWARIVDSDENYVMQGTAGVGLGAYDFTINAEVTAPGNPVVVSSIEFNLVDLL